MSLIRRRLVFLLQHRILVLPRLAARSAQFCPVVLVQHDLILRRYPQRIRIGQLERADTQTQSI